MARNFLLFWRPETVESHLNDNYLLNHAGSNQLNRAAAGDTLWIVTTGEGDELCLAGRLKVGAVVRLAEACRRLGRADLWASDWHALAAPGTAQRMCGIGLGNAAADLRFCGMNETNCLTLTISGGVHPSQLKIMRQLDSASSLMLAQLYSEWRNMILIQR